MTDDLDFSIDDEAPKEGPSSTPPTPPPPTVVIEYRNRALPSMLLPPLLLLLLAAGVVAYRVRTPDWQGYTALRKARRPVESKPADPPPQVALAPITVVAFNRPAAPPPALTPEVTPARPEPAAEAVPEIVPEPAGKPPEPGPSVPFALRPPSPPQPPPLRQPVVDPAAIEADIRREAAKNRADRQQWAIRKPQLLAQDAQETVLRRWLELKNALTRAEIDRQQFRADLSRLIGPAGPRPRTGTKDLAEKILRLCDRYGRETLPQIVDRVNQELAEPVTRLKRAERINRLRGIGAPETRILDYLTQAEVANIPARGGPRDEHDALYRAARMLLATPLAKAKPATAPAPGVPISQVTATSRPAAARRPTAR